MCSQAGVVKKLQEKLWSQNLIRYVLELKPVCNSHQDGLRENGVKWRKRNAVSSFGTRDLYKKATSNQGDWWQEEILPITQLLQESIFWDPTSSERPISLEKKRKNEKEPFLHYTLERTEVPHTLCLFCICCKRAAFWNNLAEQHK